MIIGNFIEEARIGGPQIRNLMIAKELQKKTNIHLLFPKNDSKKLVNQCLKYNIKYQTIPIVSPKLSLGGLIRYIFFFPFDVIKIIKIFKKKKFDIIHSSGGAWQIKAIIAAKLIDVKVIWELNDTYTPRIFRYLFFFLSRLASGFLFASHRTKKYYIKYLPNKKKKIIIQSPVETSKFDPRLNYSLNNFVKKLKRKKIIIGTVANINPTKDLGILIKSIKKISYDPNKLAFIIVGSIFKSQKNIIKIY